MVIADCFFVKRHISIPIESLHEKMDPVASIPEVRLDPNGEGHRNPRVICERMGFEYMHLKYMDCRNYYSTYLEFDDYQWINAFLILWMKQVTPTSDLE